MVRKLIGQLMIDSGQIFITDPGYPKLRSAPTIAARLGWG